MVGWTPYLSTAPIIRNANTQSTSFLNILTLDWLYIHVMPLCLSWVRSAEVTCICNVWRLVYNLLVGYLHRLGRWCALWVFIWACVVLWCLQCECRTIQNGWCPGTQGHNHGAMAAAALPLGGCGSDSSCRFFCRSGWCRIVARCSSFLQFLACQSLFLSAFRPLVLLAMAVVCSWTCPMTF